MDDINYFDIIVLALISIIGLKGIFRGFIKELFSLIGLVGGVYFASRLATTVGNIIKEPLAISNENTVSLIGFIISLIGFWIITYILGLTISKIFQLSGLGLFDRFLGLVFGIAKVFLLFSIIIYAFSHFESIKKKLDNATQNSLMYPILQETGNFIIKIDTSKIENKIYDEFNSSITSTKKLINTIGKEIIENEIDNQLKKDEN